MRPVPDHPTVVVLGGGGAMGARAVELASGLGAIGELVVADLDLAAAEAVVERAASGAATRLWPAAVDVTDAAALGALLDGADVVLNTTGPFYRLGVPVLRAAIEAGCHYLDICDDWEPTVDMLALHDEAERRDVLAVVGMGASPGLSNLMARLACERLDRVDDLYTGWPVDAGGGVDASVLDDALEEGMSAALLHWMQQISGRIQAVEGGDIVLRRPVAPVALDVPGMGSGTAYTVGHPEPITLRERMEVHGESANVMVLKASTAAFLQALRDGIDDGKLTVEAAAAQVLSPSPGRQARAVARSMRLRGPGGLPAFFALARGVRAGRVVTVGIWTTSLPRGMDGATSTPLVLALGQLLDGRIDAVGVHPPESVVDAEALLAALGPSCDPPRLGLDDLLVVSES